LRQKAELGPHIKVSELNLTRLANYFKQQDEEREQTLQRERDELEGRVSIDDDPFSRRKTYLGDFTKAGSTEYASPSIPIKMEHKPESKTGDAVDEMELEPPPMVAPKVPSVLMSASSSANPNKKAISLDEYKKKKMMQH